MDLKIWQSKLLSLWQQRNGYLVLSMGLLLMNLIQAVVMVGMVGRWHTVVVPANFNRPFWVNESTASAEYLAQMTEYLATLLLDVTPDDAAFNHERLLRYVEPSGYGALKNQLVATEDRMKKQAITTVFYPVDIKTDHKGLVAVITGDLKTFVGQELTSTVRGSYAARYRYHQGRLLLNAFSEVKKEEG